MVPHECCGTSPLPSVRSSSCYAPRLPHRQRETVSAATGCGILPAAVAIF